MKTIKPLYILAFVLLILGLIIAAVPANRTQHSKLNTDELLKKAVQADYFIGTDDIATQLVQEKPDVQLIDVRNVDEYDQFHIKGAINIPMNEILSDDWKPYLDQSTYINVLYGNGNTEATQAWMLLKQLGYKNLYILQGGMVAWLKKVVNPDEPGMAATDKEIVNYELRKAAGRLLSGNNNLNVEPIEETKTSKPKLPPITPKKKKKVQGGCS